MEAPERDAGSCNQGSSSSSGSGRDLCGASMGHSERPLLMHPMILFALAAAAWHWLLQDIVPVYQIKGISKLVKLCLPKVQCFCDSLTSPPSETQFNALLMSVASLLANVCFPGWDITVLDQIVDLTLHSTLSINDLTGSLAFFSLHDPEGVRRPSWIRGLLPETRRGWKKCTWGFKSNEDEDERNDSNYRARESVTVSVPLSCTPSVSVIILHPKCQHHYPVPQVSVSLSCTPSVSVIILYPKCTVIILHPKCQCHYPLPQVSASLSCTPSVSVIILHPKCQCHHHVPQVSASLSCTPSISVIILHPKCQHHYPVPQVAASLSSTPSVSIIILHPKCQSHYPAPQVSTSLSCTPSVSVTILHPKCQRHYPAPQSVSVIILHPKYIGKSRQALWDGLGLSYLGNFYLSASKEFAVVNSALGFPPVVVGGNAVVSDSQSWP
ncbi:unnamed protein product, partial [Ranitomeya imitator]